MSQVDQRIRQCFERIMHFASSLKTQQQSTKFILPGENPLNGAEPFFKNKRVKQPLTPTLYRFTPPGIFVDVRCHPPVENGFTVSPGVVRPVQTDNAAVQVEPQGFRQRSQTGQAFAKERGFVQITGCGNERRNHVAVAVTEGHDLVTLHFFVAAEADVIAAFFRGGGGAIPVDNSEIEHPALMQQADAGSKNGVKTTEGQPAPPGGVNPGIVDFRATIRAFIDGKHFPLTAEVKYPQDIVEYLKTADFWRGAAAGSHLVGEDKFLELQKG